MANDDDGDDADSGGEGGGLGDAHKPPKRKVAILMGYCGRNYYGMQACVEAPSVRRVRVAKLGSPSADERVHAFGPAAAAATVSNPGMRTIESELFRALHLAGGVSDANAEDPRKVRAVRGPEWAWGHAPMPLGVDGRRGCGRRRAPWVRARAVRRVAQYHFNRAARTDRGVHAAGQVVSLKLQLVPDLVKHINTHLPPEIRVFGPWAKRAHAASPARRFRRRGRSA